MNSFAKPDFVVEESQIQITPNILSVLDAKCTVKARVFNIGKATGDSVTLLVKRKYANGSDTVLFSKKIQSVRFSDSVSIEVPLLGLRDKGTNEIIVSIDNDNQYDELSETNNTASKSFTIFEDELTPVYPANFAIVNRQNIKLSSSTANPIVASRQYLMEMDTTELFNSPVKVSKNIVSTGGLIEFDPATTFSDSTVYYWKIGRVNGSQFIFKYGETF